MPQNWVSDTIACVTLNTINNVVQCFMILLGGGMWKLSSSSMLLVCMEPQTHVVITISGLTFQPYALIATIRGLYLLLLVKMAWFVYLSCTNVNSSIWILNLGFDVCARGCSCGALSTYIMYGQSLALYILLSGMCTVVPMWDGISLWVFTFFTNVCKCVVPCVDT